ncbi:MAG: glycoside hydrolase family 9 protein [Bacteroidia bacterium]|nr:glycoside hydrolase family 9 protein [Bacteroidia bacterium]
MIGRITFVSLLLLSSLITSGSSWIRINQMGYLPQSVKVAVFISEEPIENTQFQLVDAVSDKVVFESLSVSYDGKRWGMKSAARLNFSKFSEQGRYYVKAGNTRSTEFPISPDVYKGTADYILNYMRQQQCGYNPYLKDSCHTHDGFIVDHPTKTGQIIDVKGGWHDATDYLQYTTTSANAVYQMLFAYLKNPEVFGDQYNASGLPGPDGIPDILNEVRWGLDWLVKMNPDSTEMYNQIADDRDHAGFRLPNKDSASYGKGLYRPVYFVTGKVQGLSKYKNRTTGVSSTAGKFSSAFALGARIFQKSNPEFSKMLVHKAKQAYAFGLTDLGVAQTASVVSPYFYEEDNYIDDLELAAITLYQLNGDEYYLKQANYWGQLEPITPWMEKGSARHYQYYPFVNLGHANQANMDIPDAISYSGLMKNGLKAIYERGKTDPFLNGIPFIWCSNNLNVAAITQARLYFESTSDSTYIEMEAALRDWLFGCNPWGTSMICGLPANGDFPQYPHSSITKIKGEPTYGGLVDGPVYREIFSGHIGVGLLKKDDYQPFQNGIAVYHDDMGDYTSNEPTMDGTASLSFYLLSLEKEGIRQLRMKNCTVDNSGALVRMDNLQKTVYLIFSADEYGEGTDHILKTLSKKKVKGSFFLTGNFLRNPEFAGAIKRMIADHHYVGPHSDGHLLYSPWEKRDSMLVTQKQFNDDITNNFEELGKFGVRPEVVKYFLSPYEWYNLTISRWSAQRNMQLINFTPGVGTNADYTTPEMANYKSSKQLTERLMKFETTNPDKLNGAIVLIHLGTHPDRKDKFFDSLDQIIETLSKNGYSFKALP